MNEPKRAEENEIIKLSDQEKNILQHALLMTQANDKYFWDKVLYRFHSLSETSEPFSHKYTKQQLQQYYYQSLTLTKNKSSKSAGLRKKKKQNGSDEEEDGYMMAEKLIGIEKGKKKMTRKRTIRSMLKWADNDHRDDIFQQKKQSKFKFQLSIDEEEEERESQSKLIKQYFPEKDYVTSTKEIVTPKKAIKFDFSACTQSHSVLRAIDLNQMDTYVNKLPKKRKR